MASVLTFAYLRELQKKERTSRKLENLPADFYTTISEYLARKGIQNDVESARPIIKYILERREQKVLELAAMSVSADIAPENLLPEEKELFDAAQSLLKAHRDVIGNLFEKKSKPTEASEDRMSEERDASESEEKEPPKEKPVNARLEALKEVPSFIAEDLAAHGPWKQGDVVECPPKAAKVLVDNGFAKYS